MRSRFRFKTDFATAAALLAGIGLSAALAAEPQADLQHWRDAVSASAWSASCQVEVITSSDEDGIHAVTHEWVTAKGDYRARIYRDYDTSEVVVTAGKSWTRDLNGRVRPAFGMFLKSLRTNAAELSTIVFGPPPNAAATRLDTTGDSNVVMAIATRGGDTVVWHLDRASGLPIKSIRVAEDPTITTTYDDWRTIDGHRIPFHGTVEQEDTPTYTWTRTEVKFSTTTNTETLSAPTPGPPDTYFNGEPTPIPFTFENEHVIFKVRVNDGPEMWWLLDTGADQNVFNRAHVQQFGLEEYGATATTGGGGSADYGYARGATFKLPGLFVRNQHVGVMDLTGLERAYGLLMGGILGYDFISRFVLEIDYEKKVVLLHDPSRWTYQGTDLILPVILDDGIPYSEATISVPTRPDIPALMLIDYGAVETMTLTSPFVKANDLLNLAGTNPSVNKMAGLEGQFFTQTNSRGRVERLVMGPLSIDSFPVNLSANTTGAYASTHFSGTVGEGIFKRYHTWLDYNSSRIILDPTAAAAQPFPERKTYGMTLVASGDDYHTFTVSGVRAGSPAEQDGFVKGDIITGLDGVGAEVFTLGELRDRLTREGDTVAIQFRRGDSTLTRSVEVQRVSLEQR